MDATDYLQDASHYARTPGTARRDSTTEALVQTSSAFPSPCVAETPDMGGCGNDIAETDTDEVALSEKAVGKSAGGDGAAGWGWL